MEDVLEVYHRPYDEKRPLVALDETSKQLVGEVVQPLPPEPGQPERFDDEYVRNGTANLFMVSERLLGRRAVRVTERRTAKDYAEVLRWLAEDVHPDAEVIVLVQDNLNTHTLASLYEAFPPERARRCLDRRIASAEELRREVGAWEGERNERAVPVRWRFTTAEARIKLHRLYPSLP